MKDLKNKGISLVTLSASIVVLIILSSIMISSSVKGIKLGELKRLQNDIELLEDTVEIYQIENKALPTIIKYPSEKITIGADYRNPNDDDNYWVIDIQKLDGISLNYGADNSKITSDMTETDLLKYNDIYIINEQSHQIYYLRGLQVENKIHYTNSIGEEIEINQ